MQKKGTEWGKNTNYITFSVSIFAWSSKDLFSTFSIPRKGRTACQGFSLQFGNSIHSFFFFLIFRFNFEQLECSL